MVAVAIIDDPAQFCEIRAQPGTVSCRILLRQRWRFAAEMDGSGKQGVFECSDGE
jgi:hypothetical protein